MSSAALQRWRGSRAANLAELLAAHHQVAGPGPGRRVRVRVGVSGSGDTAEVPIKMSALREAPSGSISVSSVTSVDGRLVAQVEVAGLGIERGIQVWADRDTSRSLETLLGPEQARAELAGFAAHVVASMLESGRELGDYSLSRADARHLVARVTGQSTP